MYKQNNELTDNLFTLIKSLTPAEKRQFTSFAGRIPLNNESKFINLFKILTIQEKYNEKEILKKTSITKLQLSNVKANLYSQILVSLRLNPSKRNVPLQIREQLDFAFILYRKGLYLQSLKLLDKLKVLAMHYEEKTIGYEILDLEKIIESQYITRSRANRADLLIEETHKLTYLNSVASRLSNLTLHLYSIFLKNGYARTLQEKDKVSEHFFGDLPDYNDKRLGFREKLWYNQAYLWYSFIIQDFISCYKYAKRWVSLFDKSPHLIAVHPVFYIKGNHYVLESLFYLNRVKQFETTLDSFETIIGSTHIPEDDNIIVLSFFYVYSNKLNLKFMKAEYSGGEELLDTINKRIERYRDKVDRHHVMILYYKMACLYFGNRNYSKCIFFLKKIIDDKTTQLREDLVCFTLILNLAAHYEAGQDYRLEALIKTTRVFLSKMNHLHEVQKALIQFLGKLPEVSPLDLKNEFIKFHAILSQYENHPFERRAFLYLDLLSWLESHINDEPIANVIARKVDRT